jgi:DNA-binding winged helix-turn-helix (wHTH) protein
LLTRDDEVVRLTPKAFELLCLLVESGGRAISKAEMMQALWSDSFVEESNLAFQISVVRKALGEDGPKWIETVPKYGYRFSVGAVQGAAPSLIPLSARRQPRRRVLPVIVPAVFTRCWRLR